MATQQIYHHQFGTLDIDDQIVLQFPNGLIGFEHLHKFILVNDEDTQPFYWLVAVEEPETTFPVLPPKIIDESYETSISNGNANTVLAISCLREQIENSYINLRSPIIINNKTQPGKQIVLDDERWKFQHPLQSSSTRR